jgi:hypothetical protein
MDAEGSEWEILFATPASVLRKIRHIFLGYHEVHARLDFQPNELFAYLSRAGHKFAALGRADQSGLKDTQRVSPNNEISGN